MLHPSAKDSLAIFFEKTVNIILKYEEYFTDSRPQDLSHKEIHVIEAIAQAIGTGEYARATDIAASLRVTPGTFTSAADVLEKKGYIKRTRDAKDRRGIRVSLTEKGVSADSMHKNFHNQLAEELLEYANSENEQILVKAAEILQSFYKKKNAPGKGGKVKIYADSTCDIAPEDAARMGITIIPMSITFGNEVYRQHIDLTTRGFFQKLAESDEMPTSSQLTPFDLAQIYKEAAKDGSEAVAIHLSSALSGTYQSAVIAARDIPGVYPVDSQSATAGIAILARAAAQMRDSGKSAREIAKKIVELSGKVTVLAYVPTLKYLVRGGRISSAAGFVGNILNVYPIISVRDGVVTSIKKVKGKNAALREIVNIANEYGIDKEYGVIFVHADARADMEQLKRGLESQIAGCEQMDCEIGAVIGTHTGPGAAGLAFITKN
jgi:DegV family protein with EDD domain